MLVRPGRIVLPDERAAEAAGPLGKASITQLQTSRLCTDISTSTSPDRLALKNQSADISVVVEVVTGMPLRLHHDDFAGVALMDLLDCLPQEHVPGSSSAVRPGKRSSRPSPRLPDC